MENEKIGEAAPQSDAPVEKTTGSQTQGAARPRRRSRPGRKQGQTDNAALGSEPQNRSDQTRRNADTPGQAGPAPRQAANAPGPAAKQAANASEQSASASRTSVGGSAKQNRSFRAGNDSRQAEKHPRKGTEAPAVPDRTFRPLERAPRPEDKTRRSDKSPKRASGKEGAAKTTNRWTKHDFILQLAVVILGVVVTFVGSGLVGRWRQAREVCTVMQLVYEELGTDCAELKDICSSLDYDRRGMGLLKCHNMDYRRIPVDSLAKYQFILGHIRDFELHDDALEVLRSSGAIMAIYDKQLLLDVFGCYSWMDRFASSLDTYNEQKLNSLNHLFASGLNGAIGGADPRETWRIFMEDTMCGAFLGTMENWFGSELLDGEAVGRIERVRRALSEKYGFE